MTRGKNAREHKLASEMKEWKEKRRATTHKQTDLFLKCGCVASSLSAMREADKLLRRGVEQRLVVAGEEGDTHDHSTCTFHNALPHTRRSSLKKKRQDQIKKTKKKTKTYQ